MKTKIILFAIILASFGVKAQVSPFNSYGFDKFGTGLDSLRLNGGQNGTRVIYTSKWIKALIASGGGGGTPDTTLYRTVANSFNKAQTNTQIANALTAYTPASQVQNSLTPNSTTLAPSITAVNGGLALKANLSGGNTFSGDQNINGILAVKSAGSGTDILVGDIGAPTFGNISVNKARTTIDWHAVEDIMTATIPSTTGTGYSSFDAKPVIISTGGIDHFVGYQSRLQFRGTGNIGSYMHGFDIANFHTSTGNIANNVGLDISDINVNGGGTVTNDYGIFIKPILNGSSNNYAIYSTGGKSYFANKITNAESFDVNRIGDGTSYNLNNSSGLLRWGIGYVNSEAGSNSGSDLSFYRYNDGGGYLNRDFIIKRSTGNVLIGTETDNGEKLQVTGKATVSTAPTNPTDVVRKTELDLKQNTLTSATYDAVSNQTQFNWIGDSYIDLSSGWNSPELHFKKTTGFKSVNYGVSGQTTNQIKARFDALPTELYKQRFILEGGRNDIDLNGAISGTATTIKANYAAMVATLTANGNSNGFLIPAIIPKNSETCATTAGIFVAQLNADLLALYPNNFVPMLSTLQANGNGSANDNADIANCIVPRSLMFDLIHLNTSGFVIYDNNIIAKIGNIMPDATKYVAVANLGGILQQGQLSFSLGTGGSFNIGDYNAIKIPNQASTAFFNTIQIGNSGKGLTHTTGTEGQSNFLIGFGVGNNGVFTGSTNTGIGTNALYNNTSGGGNIAIGESPLLSNTTGGNNIALGSSSLRSNLTGGLNIGIGDNSLKAITASGNNIAIGFNSAQAITGTNGTNNNNVSIGVSAFQNSTGGSANVAIGTESLKGTANSNSNNTALGYQTLFATTTGSNNIGIGYRSADNLTTGTKNIVIGSDADVQSATASNQLNIGNAIWGTGLSATGIATTTALIGINNIAPNVTFDVVGTSSTQGQRMGIVTKTANYTVTATDYTILANATSAGFTVTLPTALSAYNATTLTGAIYNIKKIDASANVVTVQANGAELIDGANTKTLPSAMLNIQIQSNGTSWFIL